MKASDYIIKYLYEQKVHCIYEVIGGMITHLIDSAYNHEKINLVSCHHEQAAAFAADAMGRVTGVPGISLATSGPGATNLITGIATCYFDSSPAIFITGQVNRNELRMERPIRQLGFQEADIVSMVQPITKAAWRVNAAEEIPHLLKKAFNVALSGRPGPVLIDIPMDVQRAEVINEDFTSIPVSRGTVDGILVEEVLFELSRAKRPLILAGGGINSAHARRLFREFVEKINIPVVNSLMAVDVLPYHHPLRAGMIGTYGNRWSNLALGLSDALLVLGSRLDIRQTGSDTNAFKGNRKIYHVDCEASEINNRVTGCTAIVSHLHPFLTAASRKIPHGGLNNYTGWIDELKQFKQKWPDTNELKIYEGINPNKFMHELSGKSNLAEAFIADIGQNQMWAAQSLDLKADQRFLTSGGMAPMGYALPAAIGTCFAYNKRPVVMISGDGGFQLNIQELQTIVRNNLPVKMIILNNKCYGMVRQFQESYFESRYQSTCWGYSAPDFTNIARAYGIQSSILENESQIESALEQVWNDPQSPFLLEVVIPMTTNVYPKISFGHPITEMEPFAQTLKSKST